MLTRALSRVPHIHENVGRPDCLGSVEMGVPELIGRHSRQPRGLVGRVITRMMARKTSASIPWTVGLLGLEPNHRVVEVGFGHGDSLAALLNSVPGGHVAGVELSATMVAAAAKRFKEPLGRGQLSLYHTEDGALPVPDTSFDRAVTLNTIYVTADPTALFGELFRVLAPGGKAAITFPERQRFAEFPPAQTEGFFLHELSDLEAAMASVGFSDVAVQSNPGLPLAPMSLFGVRPQLS